MKAIWNIYVLGTRGLVEERLWLIEIVRAVDTTLGNWL
jgi:hypothetical protein